MKVSSLLLILPLAVIILQSCHSTDKTEEMGDTTTATDHIVVGVPEAPGIRKRNPGGNVY